MRIIICLIAVLTAFTAFAGEKFGGYIGVGGGYISTDDRLQVSDDNRNYDDEAKDALLFITGELKYRATDNITYHIGVPQEAAEMAVKAGISVKFSESEIDLSALYKPSDVWQNPYLDYRTKTDETVAGFSARYDGIAGTPLFTEAKYLSHDIDRDTAGEAFSELRRDGAETDIKFGYAVKKRLEIYVRYIDDKRDGKAESSGTSAQGLLLRLPLKSKDLFMAGAEARFSRFDGRNPYFDGTREDASMRVFANYMFNSILGKNRYVSVGGFYMKNASNIEYFDSSTFGTVISAGVRF